jgi:hypothetical protein
MMSSQNPMDSIYSPRQNMAEDSRLKRNVREDLHTALDLAYKFRDELELLHPQAARHVKLLLAQGNLL